MSEEANLEKRLFILDTNVLMHDPTAIFRFHEHDIFLPMVVLEELDKAKKGMSEVASNVRQVNRFLDELMHGATKAEIDAGLPLPTPANGKSDDLAESGRLFFRSETCQTRSLRTCQATPQTTPYWARP